MMPNDEMKIPLNENREPQKVVQITPQLADAVAEKVYALLLQDLTLENERSRFGVRNPFRWGARNYKGR